jgi:hypothetical protein
MPVDVIATFNTLGRIKPNFIRLEDNRHELQTYKIFDIEQVKEEKYAGLNMILFICNVPVGDSTRQVKLRYHIDTHKWMLIQ